VLVRRRPEGAFLPGLVAALQRSPRDPVPWLMAGVWGIWDGVLRLSHRGGGFARSPPPSVLVDTDPGIPLCGSRFGFVVYFTRHPPFAEVWSHTG
jgi:hypothetical protein